MTQLVSLSLDLALHAVAVVRGQFCLSHHFSVDVPLMPYCPRAEDVRRSLVPSPSNGSRTDKGAVSALYREKKKADHTLQ